MNGLMKTDITMDLLLKIKKASLKKKETLRKHLILEFQKYKR